MDVSQAISQRSIKQRQTFDDFLPFSDVVLLIVVLYLIYGPFWER